MATARTFSTGNYLVTVDGVKCGFAKSVVGGDISADVVEEAAAPGQITKKHIGPPRYEDMSVEIGFGLSQPIYAWIAASWAGNHVRKDGSITATDVNSKAVSEHQFFHALLTETT